MICPRCREELPEDTMECPVCSFTFEEGKPYLAENLIGYSDKIDARIFKKRALQGKRSFIVTGYVIATLFLVLTPYFGITGGSLNPATSIFAGIVCAGFFSYFATLQLKALLKDKTWDGVIEDKDVEIRTGKKGGEFHKVKVRKNDSGESNWYTFQDGRAIVRYYEEGSKVRHHKGFNYFEKFDKSLDREVICIHCGHFTEMSEDQCDHCRMPLLK